MQFVTSDNAEKIRFNKKCEFDLEATFDGDINFSNSCPHILIQDDAADALEIAQGANVYMIFDTTNNAERIHAKEDLVQNPSASIAPASNGELVVEATNNTTITFKLKGSDGTVRTGTLTLS